MISEKNHKSNCTSGKSDHESDCPPGRPIRVTMKVIALHDKKRTEDQSHTADVGQRQYRAKEVRRLMKGKRKAVYGCTADVWSIGAVLYEMATGEKFNQLTEEEFWQGKLFRPDEKLAKLKDKALSDFLSKCLRWDSSARSRCDELLRDEYMVSRLGSGSIHKRDCNGFEASHTFLTHPGFMHSKTK